MVGQCALKRRGGCASGVLQCDILFAEASKEKQIGVSAMMSPPIQSLAARVVSSVSVVPATRPHLNYLALAKLQLSPSNRLLQELPKVPVGRYECMYMYCVYIVVVVLHGAFEPIS
jgi:hypothetical protein